MPLAFHPQATASLNSKAAALAPVEVPTGTSTASPLPPEHVMPHIAGTFGEDDILDIIGETVTEEGTVVGLQFSAAGKLYKLADEEYLPFAALVGTVHRSKGWSRAASEKSIAAASVAWLRAKLDGVEQRDYCSYLVSTLNAELALHRVLVPLHLTRVFEPFPVGPAIVRPLQESDIDAWFTDPKKPGELFPHIEPVLLRCKKEMQGSAVVDVSIEATAARAREIALGYAFDIAGFLRCFSLGQISPISRSYLAPLGSEDLVKQHSIIVLPDGTGRLSDEIVLQGPLVQEYTPAHVAYCRKFGLDRLGTLLIERDLSSLEESLLTAFRLYARASLETGLAEKLLHTIVALETLLVRNSTEPLQDNISVRLAFLVGRSLKEREAIVANVKAAYAMRSQFVHHGTRNPNLEAARPFLELAHTAIFNILRNTDKVQSKDQLIAILERRKLS